MTSLLTFLLMFLPRARQMVAMGKDELFTDSDQLGPQVTVTHQTHHQPNRAILNFPQMIENLMSCVDNKTKTSYLHEILALLGDIYIRAFHTFLRTSKIVRNIRKWARFISYRNWEMVTMLNFS